MKNVVGSNDEVRVCGKEEPLPWGKTIIEDATDGVCDIIKFITSPHYTLALYREKANAISAQDKERLDVLGGTEFVNFCDTRFASKVPMTARYHLVHFIAEASMVDREFGLWLEEQKKVTKEKGYDIKNKVSSSAHLKAVLATCKLGA